MKRLFFIFIAIFWVASSNAQTFSKRLQFADGHILSQATFIILNDHSVITEKKRQKGFLAGYSIVSNSDTLLSPLFGQTTTAAGTISSLDRNGNSLWTKIYRYNSYNAITNVVSTKNNSAYIEFLSYNMPILNGGIPYADPTILAKIDSNGNTIWSKKMGFNRGGAVYHFINTKRSFANTNEDVFIAGQQDDTIKTGPFGDYYGRNQIACFKISPNGDKIFAKKYLLPQIYATNYTISETPEGNALLSGSIRDTSDINKYYFFILKIDGHTGNPIWMKAYDSLYSTNVVSASSGSIILKHNGIIRRLDSNGVPTTPFLSSQINTTVSYLDKFNIKNDTIFSLNYKDNIKLLMLQDTLGNILFQKAWERVGNIFFLNFNVNSDNTICSLERGSPRFSGVPETWYIQQLNAQYQSNCPSIDTICNIFSTPTPISYRNITNIQTRNLDIYDIQGESRPLFYLHNRLLRSYFAAPFACV